MNSFTNCRIRTAAWQVLLAFSLVTTMFSGCSKDKTSGVVEQPDGIVFNPVTPYQEALPGQVISFKMRVKAPEPLTGFSIRLKLPGATDYVALPEYPDVTTNANELFTPFTNFEYSLPPAVAATDAEVKFKFIATTASKTYEKEYTVRIVGKGLQQVRLYNTTVTSLFTFGSIDLLTGKGVRADAPATTKDLTASLAQLTTLDGNVFTGIYGWDGGNGTKFKEVTEANYKAAPTQYATIYNGIAAANELTGVSTLIPVIRDGKGPLIMTKPWYIAKVNRNGVFSYVALLVKRIPAGTVIEVNGTSTLDKDNQYIQLEITK